MARISTYGIDAKPELSDKVIGTDTAPGADLRTKNYSLGEIIDLFNQSNELGVADQSIFLFQNDISLGRESGTISFYDFCQFLIFQIINAYYYIFITENSTPS